MNLEHIEKFLIDNISPSIDVSDVADKPADQLRRFKITRSLVALALSEVTGLEFANACTKITDGFDDQGVDGFFLDTISKTFWIVQAKSSVSGTGGVGRGEVNNFIEGVEKVLQRKFDEFNQKIKDRISEIETALESTDVKFRLLFINLGEEIAEKSEEPIKSFLERQNRDTDEPWVEFDQFINADISEIVARHELSKEIKLKVSLSYWGVSQSPFKSYYGTVSASEVGEWYKKYGAYLFSKNIRNFLGVGEINSKISKTLESEPQNFFYLNNGITLICEDVVKTRDFGSETHAGNFECKGVQIINGAQTVGTIGAVYKTNPDVLNLAKVMIKIISLKGAAKGFSGKITIAANSQNRIEAMDFVSMDTVQIRLEKDILKNHGIRYARLRGSTSVSGKVITLEQAAAALCCANESIQYSTQIKREKNKIWEDVESEFYKKIFPDDLETWSVINSLELMALVDEFLVEKIKTATSSREKLLCQSGNRFFAHIFFAKIDPVVRGRMAGMDVSKDLAKAKESNLSALYDKTVLELEQSDFKNAQLARLFITQSRVESLKKKVLAS